MLVRARDTDWEGVRLHVVTGKGGTGKTTVAGALALALASAGGRVLLMEMEGRQGIAQLFDCPPLPYGERKVAVAPGTATVPGGDVYALAADAESALIEYLEMFYNLRHAGRTLTRLGIVDFATTIAPGLRDVLLTGKAAGIEGSLGPDGSTDVADALAAELGEDATGVLSQREHRRELASAGQPCYDLPLVTDRMDLAGLYRLAAALQEQGAA